MATVNHDLPRMFEVDCNAPANIRLNLAKAPIRLVGMADQHSGFKQCIHSLFRFQSR